MVLRAGRVGRAFGLAVALAVAVVGIGVPAGATAPVAGIGRSMPADPALLPLGTVVDSQPLPASLWIPGTTRAAYVLTYVTSDGFGHKALSTGTVFIPNGTAPVGGWPVISWAHGTSGLGDSCAPSRRGPAEPDRDWAYLATWMRQGYAIVATDYAGLGTPGLPAYLDGRSEAHNVVDMVKAGREFAEELPAGQQLSRKWVTIGQSQGGGAAIYTARYATAFGGPELDYRGAVGTGTPAYIEKYALLPGPHVPPVALPAGMTSYLAYIFASLRTFHPELGIDSILTPAGRQVLAMAETECVEEFDAKLGGVSIGDWFTQPVVLLPNYLATTQAYLGMPETGFDKPFFMGHGVLDTDVPYALTALYAAVLTLNGQPVTFRSYLGDHNSTMALSQADSIPFVRGLFAR